MNFLFSDKSNWLDGDKVFSMEIDYKTTKIRYKTYRSLKGIHY